MKLMTGNEVNERLGNDEDALDLSIEKWERLVQAAKEKQEIDCFDIDGDTCALCQVAPPEKCNECVYFKHYDVECSEKHWRGAINALRSNKNLIGAFESMLDALKEIKENQ